MTMMTAPPPSHSAPLKLTTDQSTVHSSNLIQLKGNKWSERVEKENFRAMLSEQLLFKIKKKAHQHN